MRHTPVSRDRHLRRAKLVTGGLAVGSLAATAASAVALQPAKASSTTTLNPAQAPAGAQAAQAALPYVPPPTIRPVLPKDKPRPVQATRVVVSAPQQQYAAPAAPAAVAPPPAAPAPAPAAAPVTVSSGSRP